MASYANPWQTPRHTMATHDIPRTTVVSLATLISFSGNPYDTTGQFDLSSAMAGRALLVTILPDPTRT